MSPQEKKLARELWPEFYHQRLQQLDESITLQKRLARLKIEGIKSKEDLLLQYAVEAGYIATDPLEHILHPERAEAAQDRRTQQERYGRGLLNPNRFLRGDWGGFYRTDNAKQATGRSNVPASLLGTGNQGFSAVGTITPDQEILSTNYQRGLDYLNIK